MSGATTTKPKRGSGGMEIGFGPSFGGGNGGGHARAAPGDTHWLGMFFALTGITMLFVALTSAYVVRKGAGGDWQPLAMPGLVWATTAVLLSSSFTLEQARRSLQNGSESALRKWMAVTLLLGAVFLAGQFETWLQLSAQGIYLGTSPHGSFYYTLTGLHGVHLLGGLAALAWVALRVRRQGLRRRMDAVALYWHFMDGLWVYLAILLFARI